MKKNKKRVPPRKDALAAQGKDTSRTPAQKQADKKAKKAAKKAAKKEARARDDVPGCLCGDCGGVRPPSEAMCAELSKLTSRGKHVKLVPVDSAQCRGPLDTVVKNMAAPTQAGMLEVQETYANAEQERAADLSEQFAERCVNRKQLDALLETIVNPFTIHSGVYTTTPYVHVTYTTDNFSFPDGLEYVDVDKEELWSIGFVWFGGDRIALSNLTLLMEHVYYNEKNNQRLGDEDASYTYQRIVEAMRDTEAFRKVTCVHCKRPAKLAPDQLFEQYYMRIGGRLSIVCTMISCQRPACRSTARQYLTDIVEASRQRIGEAMISEREMNTCYSCGRLDRGLLRCAGCSTALYCDRACQRADWKRHAMICKKRFNERDVPIISRQLLKEAKRTGNYRELAEKTMEMAGARRGPGGKGWDKATEAAIGALEHLLNPNMHISEEDQACIVNEARQKFKDHYGVDILPDDDDDDDDAATTSATSSPPSKRACSLESPRTTEPPAPVVTDSANPCVLSGEID